MDGHFRAFSFVDRITRPGPKVRGLYHIPDGLTEFPLALAAEACGQLAAWASMAVLDFKLRPVAGIAPSIELLTPVLPGQTLELEADINSLDEGAVAYDGAALVDGKPVLRLKHCVGPMVPVDEYDDPQLVKRRYELICGAGATPGAFQGVPLVALDFTGGEAGKSARAMLHVPKEGDFFTDHFPRRPVFPGTLFMHKVLELAARVAEDVSGPAKNMIWVPRQINDSKLRVFMPPGENLEFEARLAKQDGGLLTVHVEARKADATRRPEGSAPGGRVTGHSKIVFFAEERA